MRTVASIVDEIKSVKRSVSKRCSLGSCQPDDDGRRIAGLTDKMTAQITRAISNLDVVDTKAAELLYEAIVESGLDDQQVQGMTQAVDSRLEQCLDDSQHGDTRSNGQSLMEPETYMVEELWELICDKSKSLNSKMQGCTDHLARCGVKSASEKTAGMWVALCACMHFQTLPSYNVMFGHVCDLKAMVIASKTTWPFSIIQQYPKSPEHLPKHAYDHIFHGSYVPVQVSVPRLKEIFNHHTPLRSNSRLLKLEKSRMLLSIRVALHQSELAKQGCNELLQPVRICVL